MLGKEWVIYTSGLILVQIVMLFTHATRLLSRQKEIDVKKIFLNPNILAIIAGVLLFFTKIRLPGILGDTVDSVGGLIGPISMLVTGMIIGGMDLKKVFSYRHVWLISFLRLIAAPLCILLILRFSGIAELVPGGRDILLVTYLACTTPSANTITQLAQVHGNDAHYASAISVVTTLLCIVTIPVMVMLYQM
jgi:predicted permease